MTDKVYKLRVQIVQFDESKCFQKGDFIKLIGRFVDTSSTTHFSVENSEKITLLEGPKMNLKI